MPINITNPQYKGNYWSEDSAYHAMYFVGSDEATSMYTKLGIEETNIFAYAKTIQNPEFKKAYAELNENATPPENPLDIAEISPTFYYKSFDGKKLVDEEIDYSSLVTVMEYWEAKNIGYYSNGDEWANDNSQEETLKKLLLAASNKMLTTDTEASVRCLLYVLETPNDEVAISNARVTSSRGLRIADKPKRSTGGRFDARKTFDDAQNSGSVGRYVEVSDDSDPSSEVVGDVRLSYNQNTQMWESQNQLLARLITTLESAGLPNIDLSSVVDSATPEDFYDVDSELYIGGKSTAQALPLSMEEGNPSLYGPNFLACKNNKMETIRVVNRSNVKMDVGTLVMCHYIDGEWIATKFAGEAESDITGLPAKIGRWQFAKFFVPGDALFKDERFTSEFADNPNEYNGYLSPTQIENERRHAVFQAAKSANSPYTSDEQDMAAFIKMNLNPLLPPALSLGDDAAEPTVEAIEYNYKILQHSAFDQAGSELGGNASLTTLARTNVYTPIIRSSDPEATDKAYGFEELCVTWGPVFPGGYKAVYNARNKSRPVRMIGSGVAPDEFFVGGGSVSTVFDVAPTSYGTSDGGIVISMFSNAGDVNAVQLPAEIGTNGPWGEVSSPVDSWELIESSYLRSTDGAVDDNGRHVTGSWLIGEDEAPVYAMEPVSPNRVQWTACTAELACSRDIYSPLTATADGLNRYDRDFLNDAQNALSSNNGGNGQSSGNDVFGLAFNRIKSQEKRGYYTPQFPGAGFFEASCTTTYGNPFDEPIPEAQYQVPYDCMLYRQPTSLPIACVVDPFAEDVGAGRGAGLACVSTGRTIITKNGGGRFSIELDQFFGYNGPLLGGTGGGGGLSILPIGGGFTFGWSNNTMQQRRLAAWGSQDNDDIDSFGTTALHMRMFDYWPEDYTVFLAPYFAVLYFNPGKRYSKAERVNGIAKVTFPGTPNATTNYSDVSDDVDEDSEQFKADLAAGKYVRFEYDNPDDFIENVDFYLPTYGYNDPSGGKDGETVPVGKPIVGNMELRPQNKSNICTVCRGWPLQAGGLRWSENAIGLSDSYTVIDGGSGYVVGTDLDGPKGSRIRVTSTGQGGTLEQFEYIPDDQSGVDQRGTGFTPSNFDDENGYVATVQGGARVRWDSGIVYRIYKYFQGPQERIAKTRVSTGSGDGKLRVDQGAVRDYDIPDNRADSRYPGQYEAFFFFHNDISHTFIYQKGEPNGYQVPYAQYITMSIL